MTTASLINFEPRADGGEIAKLGAWTVGLIQRWPGRRGFRLYWSLTLPPASPRPHPVSSLSHAKFALLTEIADWLDGSGDQERAVKVRAQAEHLDEVAA